MKQCHDPSWLWCPVTPHNTAHLLSQVTTATDGAKSHGLNELTGHFVDIYGHSAELSQGWSITYGNGNCELYERVGWSVH